MDIVYAIWLRSMKRFIRSKSRIVGSVVMPFFLLLFLGFGLNNVVQMPNLGGNYLVFLIPGMVAMSVMFTAVGSGVQILWDKQFGFLKETLVAPVSRLEIMLGQTAGGATTAVLQGFLILIPALIIGLKVPSIAGLLIALLFMVLDRHRVHGLRDCACLTDGGHDRVPADHELCHLPDLRALGRTLPHQLAARMDRTPHAPRPADLWRGRHAVRPDRGLADRSGCLPCGHRRVLCCDSGCRSSTCSGRSSDRVHPIQLRKKCAGEMVIFR